MLHSDYKISYLTEYTHPDIIVGLNRNVVYVYKIVKKLVGTEINYWISETRIAETISNEDKYIIKYCTSEKEFYYEISKSKNYIIKEVLSIALGEFEKYMNTIKTDNYNIQCYLWNDIEVSDWQEFVVEIKTTYKDFEEMDNIWDELIKLLSKSYEAYLSRVRINEASDEKISFEKISISIHSIND